MFSGNNRRGRSPPRLRPLGVSEDRFNESTRSRILFSQNGGRSQFDTYGSNTPVGRHERSRSPIFRTGRSRSPIGQQERMWSSSFTDQDWRSSSPTGHPGRFWSSTDQDVRTWSPNADQRRFWSSTDQDMRSRSLTNDEQWRSQSPTRQQSRKWSEDNQFGNTWSPTDQQGSQQDSIDQQETPHPQIDQEISSNEPTLTPIDQLGRLQSPTDQKKKMPSLFFIRPPSFEQNGILPTPLFPPGIPPFPSRQQLSVPPPIAVQQPQSCPRPESLPILLPFLRMVPPPSILGPGPFPHPLMQQPWIPGTLPNQRFNSVGHPRLREPGLSLAADNYMSSDTILVCVVMKLVCSVGHVINLSQKKWAEFCSFTLNDQVVCEEVPVFFSRFPDQFDIQDLGDGTYDVTPKITLGLCKEHCSNAGCKEASCGSLHCCKYYLHGTCTFTDLICKYGHNLKRPHNRDLLKRHFLNLLEARELGLTLKLSTKADTLYPKICKWYNVKQGCRHNVDDENDENGKCQAMHVCRHYIDGDCTFGPRKCQKSHNIFDQQPRAILEKHGIDMDRSEEEVLEDVRGFVRKGVKNEIENYAEIKKGNYAKYNIRNHVTTSNTGNDAEYKLRNDVESENIKSETCQKECAEYGTGDSKYEDSAGFNRGNDAEFYSGNFEESTKGNDAQSEDYIEFKNMIESENGSDAKSCWEKLAESKIGKDFKSGNDAEYFDSEMEDGEIRDASRW